MALVLFSSALVAFAIHNVLAGGTCSSTGYTRYGPAPVCSSSSDRWGIVLPIATMLVIVGGVVGAPNVFVLLGPLFLGVGIGSLTVGGTFALVFGGIFAVVGAALLTGPLWTTRRLPAGVTGARLLTGGVVCCAALGSAVGVAALLRVSPSPAAAARAQPPSHPTGAVFPALAATDPQSMYRSERLKFAITVLGAYVGHDAPVRSLRLVPGGVDMSIVADSKSKAISLDATGGYLGNDPVPLRGAARTFALSSIDPSVPAGLLDRVQGQGKRVDHMTASPGRDGGIDWRAYPVGGGPPVTRSG